MREQQHKHPAVLLAFAFVGGMAAQLHAQNTVPASDFTNATVAEVRDAMGQVVLSGSFP